MQNPRKKFSIPLQIPIFFACGALFLLIFFGFYSKKVIFHSRFFVFCAFKIVIYFLNVSKSNSNTKIPMCNSRFQYTFRISSIDVSMNRDSIIVGVYWNSEDIIILKSLKGYTEILRDWNLKGYTEISILNCNPEGILKSQRGILKSQGVYWNPEGILKSWWTEISRGILKFPPPARVYWNILCVHRVPDTPNHRQM